MPLDPKDIDFVQGLNTPRNWPSGRLGYEPPAPLHYVPASGPRWVRFIKTCDWEGRPQGASVVDAAKGTCVTAMRARRYSAKSLLFGKDDDGGVDVVEIDVGNGTLYVVETLAFVLEKLGIEVA